MMDHLLIVLAINDPLIFQMLAAMCLTASGSESRMLLADMSGSNVD
jgi:hypothetical protein